MNSLFSTVAAINSAAPASAPLAIKSVSHLAGVAMLAAVSISKWSAGKVDKRVTREVADAHNTDASAGRYNKRLIAKDALDKIATVESEARKDHHARTLPWSDDGPRILSAAGFADWSARMREHKAKFESAVADFVQNYPALIDDARVRLNGLFNEADYPPASDIARKFRFEIRVENMPDSSDFRVALGDSQVAAIRADMDARAQEAFSAATRDVWQRIADRVGHMAEKLRSYKPAGAAGDRSQGTFHASLVENVRELVALLPALNIANDPALDAVAKRMAKELCAEDATALRASAMARETVAASAESILANVREYL